MQGRRLGDCSAPASQEAEGTEGTPRPTRSGGQADCWEGLLSGAVFSSARWRIDDGEQGDDGMCILDMLEYFDIHLI